MREGAALTDRYWRLGTWACLGVAATLRSVLAVNGGQQFWPDEDRFDRARGVAEQLLAGQRLDALRETFKNADHILFRILCVGPAILESVFHAGPWLPALFFAAASTAMLWALGRAAGAAGGGEAERFFVVVAATSSATLVYFARHFFPYDLAILAFLLGLSAVFDIERPFRSGLVAGIWAAIGFLTYNGYWTLTLALSGLAVVTAPTLRALGLRSLGYLAGFSPPLIAILAIGHWLGFNMIAEYRQFSGNIGMGDWHLGWRMVGEYFHAAEGPNATLALLAGMGLLIAAMNSRRPLGGVYAVLIGCIVYALMVTLSDVVPLMTLGGRHVRALAPFGAWAIGSMVAWLWDRRGAGRIAAGLLLTGVAWIGASKLKPLFGQVFPREAPVAARAAVFAKHRRGVGLEPLQLVNDVFYHNPHWVQTPPYATHRYWSAPHPLDYVPNLFESYSEEQRAAFLAQKRSISLVAFDGVVPLTHAPYAFNLTYTPGEPNALHSPEPLLCSGEPDTGDLVALVFDEEHTSARILHDHLGAPSGDCSESFPFKRGVPHTLQVIAPCLLDSESMSPKSQALWKQWGHRLFVRVDGTVVMNAPVSWSPASPDSVAIGLNLIHSRSAVSSLQMNHVYFSALDPGEWAKAGTAPPN